MNLISIVFTFVILMIILNPQMIFGAYAPDEVEIQVATDKPSYKHGDILTIKGSGAHSYTVFIEIIDPNGKVITNLMFIAGNNGDFSTAWIIPNGIERGTYTIQVEDIIKKAQTTFQLGIVNMSQDVQQSSDTKLKTQIKNGISPNFLTCTDGFELIFKLRDSSPACVTPKTAEKLIERGWTSKLSNETMMEIFNDTKIWVEVPLPINTSFDEELFSSFNLVFIQSNVEIYDWIKNYHIEENDIIIYDVDLSKNFGMNCFGIGCQTGTWSILIDDSNLQLMLDIGFTISE